MIPIEVGVLADYLKRYMDYNEAIKEAYSIIDYLKGRDYEITVCSKGGE